MESELLSASYSPFWGSPLLPLLLLSVAQQKSAPNLATDFKEEYDYVIVGGGAAGSVVASRLSEVPCASVLVLEAGKPASLITDVPVVGENFTDPDYFWNYKTVPQKHAGFGSINNQIDWPTGKGVGGSSLVNAMLYLRGNHKDYDEWAQLGAVGWSFSDVRPYFFKLEDNQDEDFLENGYHVVGGPVSFERPYYHSEIQTPLYDTAEFLGYEIIDVNGPTQVGYYDIQGFQRNGQRCSAAKSHLIPAENRTNLDILANAFVRKVLIKHKKAIGVEFEYENSKHTVKARREVILSAGTINSAQLLMLSGIGPKQHLKDMKIPVKADLPVGNNLQDHVGAPVPFQINPDIPSLREKFQNQTHIQEYIDHRTGLLTSNAGVSMMAFLKGPPSYEPDVPDIELTFQEARPARHLKSRYRLNDEVYKNSYGVYENSTMYLCMAENIKPRSRGWVRLKSANPHDFPLINPNYYGDARDLDVVENAIKMCLDIGESEPMRRSVGSKHFSESLGGCQAGNYSCFARTVTRAFSHPVGTARMGDPKNPLTVVDHQLRVKTICGLRVVDASVMPTIPSGNIYIPTIMVAERASDIIKSTINCNTQIPFE